MADEPFLSRWSKRKSEARAGVPAGDGEPLAPAPSAQTQAPVEVPAEPLPAVETLTPESDFTGFMKPEVDEDLKRKALKTLFRDPHFNVMDGLDVYIDDYSKPDPIPESWFGKMTQMARLGAFEEKPESTAETLVKSAEIEPGSGSGEVEKPSAEQGLASPASSKTPDTGNGGESPPLMPE